MSEKTETFLEHYGVRGMKWGVRRIRSARARKAVNTRPSDEGRAAQKILVKQKTYGTLALTNHELRVVNARIKLEQEFQKAVPLPKSKVKKGMEFADKLFTYDEKVRKFSGDGKNNGPGVLALINRGRKVMTAKP